jgi:hypothetical protein
MKELLLRVDSVAERLLSGKVRYPIVAMSGGGQHQSFATQQAAGDKRSFEVTTPQRDGMPEGGHPWKRPAANVPGTTSIAGLAD